MAETPSSSTSARTPASGHGPIVHVAFSIGRPRVRSGPDGTRSGRASRAAFRCICFNSGVVLKSRRRRRRRRRDRVRRRARRRAARTRSRPGVTVLDTASAASPRSPARRTDRARGRAADRRSSTAARRWPSRPPQLGDQRERRPAPSARRSPRRRAAASACRSGSPTTPSAPTSTSSRSSFGRKPVNAEVIGADASGPVFRAGPARPRGRARARCRTAIEQQLATGSRAPLALMMSAVAAGADARRASASIIVIDRGANTLRLFSRTRSSSTRSTSPPGSRSTRRRPGIFRSSTCRRTRGGRRRTRRGRRA